MQNELTRRILELQSTHGGLRAAARAIRCDPGYLVRLRDGKKQNPGAEMLEKLGLVRRTTIERI